MLEARFWSKVEKTARCWVWMGAQEKRDHGSYGLLRDRGKRVWAHRLSLKLHGREVPRGLVVDHLCRNTLCVNPAHLEAVTDKVNILRGTSPCAMNAKKTHCKHGHEFTAENTIVRGNGRRCRVCHYADCEARRKRKNAQNNTPARDAGGEG